MVNGGIFQPPALIGRDWLSNVALRRCGFAMVVRLRLRSLEVGTGGGIVLRTNYLIMRLSGTKPTLFYTIPYVKLRENMHEYVNA